MEQKSYQSFTELDDWKKAWEFKKEVEALSKTFPSEEKYRLSGQLVRTGRSINSRFAEGHGRHTYKDQLHFCIQARGSLSIVLNHLIDTYDCLYILQEQRQAYKLKYNEVEALLNGYISYFRSEL